MEFLTSSISIQIMTEFPTRWKQVVLIRTVMEKLTTIPILITMVFPKMLMAIIPVLQDRDRDWERLILMAMAFRIILTWIVIMMVFRMLWKHMGQMQTTM